MKMVKLMPENTITVTTSLYDKRRREIKFDIWFGILTAILLIILAAIVFVSNFVFIKVYIQGRSMYPTLKDGEMVMVNAYRAPDYGDIIVISGEKTNGDWLIKRAIAFGGDTLAIENGYVYLKKAGETEFTKLEEKYLVNQGITFYPRINDKSNVLRAEFSVAEGEIFYLGDNRTDSSDSRSSFGTCEKSQIVGVVSEFALKTKGVNTFFGQIVAFINGLFGTN